ncbi:MAG: autotransporter-associated beta strand repeat-containing protein [Chthoniobacteraceae bacterium]
MSGAISGSNGVTFTGTSDVESVVFVVQGDNPFTGQLTINSGTVRFLSAANLGADSSDIVINDAQLEYSGVDAFTLARSVRTTGWQSTLGSSGGPLTFAGAISGPASVRTKGDVTFASANRYSGYTAVVGRLTFSDDAVFGLSPLIQLVASQFGGNSGVLRLTAPWTTARTISIAGVYDSAIDTNGFDARLDGPLQSEPTTSKLVKTGLGTLQITDASEFYGGLEVSGGRLEINGQMQPGNVRARAGGTIGGGGNTGRFFGVDPAGELDPGDLATPATLSGTGFFLSNASTSHFDLASATAFDQVKANGTIWLDGLVTLSLSLDYDPQDGVDSFILFDNDGTDPIAGTNPHHFAVDGVEIDEGGLFTTDGQEFRLSYVGGDGNDVTIMAVPEPAAGGLCVTGVVAMIAGLRSRRRSALTK